MDPEYIAIIVTISVLSGVIIIALLAVCIAKILANKKLRKNLANTQLSGNTNVGAGTSFVRYSAPEPYTPTPHDFEENPWRLQTAYNNTVQEEHNPPVVDDLDNPMFALPDVTRRPSIAQFRPPSAQNIPRRSSYVHDLPRRSSYVENMPRRASHAPSKPRSRYSYAPAMPQRPYRRPSFSPSAHELSTGQQNKLWYNYLKEDPNYFTQDALERNMSQPRVWAEGGRGVQSSPPRHGPHRRQDEFPQQHQNHHHLAATRSSWI